MSGSRNNNAYFLLLFDSREIFLSLKFVTAAKLKVSCRSVLVVKPFTNLCNLICEFAVLSSLLRL